MKININITGTKRINVNNKLLCGSCQTVDKRKISKVRILVIIETNLHFVIIENDGSTIRQRVSLTYNEGKIISLLILLIVGKEGSSLSEIITSLQCATSQNNRIAIAIIIKQISVLLSYISSNNVIENRRIVCVVIQKKLLGTIVAIILSIEIKSLCHIIQPNLS